MTRCRERAGLDLCRNITRRFLEEYLPSCDCPRPVRRTRIELRAALGHLLAVLRSQGVVGEPARVVTPVDEELQKAPELS